MWKVDVFTEEDAKNLNNINNILFPIEKSEPSETVDVKLGITIPKENLLYDPDIDKNNQKWIDNKRKKHAGGYTIQYIFIRQYSILEYVFTLPIIIIDFSFLIDQVKVVKLPKVMPC